MSDISKMRSGVLHEIKYIRRFFDNMERNVKDRNPIAIQRAYTFLKVLTYHMDDGDLAPEKIAYNLELTQALEDLDS